MRVFVAGASAAVGTRLVPQLIERRNERCSARTGRPLGPEPLHLALLDREAVMEAVVARRPDAIVHQATALADLSDFKHFDRTFHQTYLLRARGTDALIAAAQAAGVTRFVAQSYASARYACSGGMVTLLARQRA